MKHYQGNCHDFVKNAAGIKRVSHPKKGDSLQAIHFFWSKPPFGVTHSYYNDDLITFSAPPALNQSICCWL